VFIDFYQQRSEITARPAPRTREIESHNLPNQIADLDLKINVEHYQKKTSALDESKSYSWFLSLASERSNKKKSLFLIIKASEIGHKFVLQQGLQPNLNMIFILITRKSYKFL
jgi:hypothetical protein